MRIDGVKFTRSARGPRRQAARTVQRAAIRRPLLVALSTTGPSRPSAIRTVLRPPKVAPPGGRGAPVGAGEASRALKRRVGLALQDVRCPPASRVPATRSVPAAIVPSAWPASDQA